MSSLLTESGFQEGLPKRLNLDIHQGVAAIGRRVNPLKRKNLSGSGAGGDFVFASMTHLY
jgi:hypothetical protein